MSKVRQKNNLSIHFTETLKMISYIVSGYPVDDGVKACLLSMEERRNDRMLEFKDKLCKCPANKDVFDPIKKRATHNLQQFISKGESKS